MPVSFSVEKPVKKQPVEGVFEKTTSEGFPVVGIPEGFEPNQVDRYPSSVKFSVERPVAAPKGGVKETAVNVTKAVGRGFETMLQGLGRAMQWAAEEGTTPEGATSFKKSAGEIASKLIPIPVAGRAAGEYVGEMADKLRPEWHKNLDIWARNAIKKVGQNVVSYYQKGIEGDILSPTPAFRQAQKMGWTTLPVEKALVATAESAPSFASAVAAGLILKNPHVPLALLGGMQATQTYGSLRDQNIDQEVASTAAFMSGALEAVTEKIPFDELLKGTAGPALKRFVKVGTMESFQELLAQMGGNYINFAAKEYKPGDLKSVEKALKIQWGELANGWFEAMSAGFLLGGGAAMAVKPPAPAAQEVVTPAPVTETTPENVTKPLQINITADETTPIQATDISDIKTLQEQVASAPMTGKQRLLLKNYIGDIETKIVKEIVDKYPEPITDQASLERVGNKIAKDLGITDEIEWAWDTKGVTRNMGTHWKTGDKKHKIRIRGNHPKHKNKAILTDTIVHEIGHIASPPVTKKADLGNLRVEPDPGGGYRVYDAKGRNYRVAWAQNPDEAIAGVINAKSKRSVHHSAFKTWLAENLKSVLPSEVSKRIPLLNEVIVAQPGYESVETFTSPEESPLIHGQYAILTAENPNAQPATPEANKAANTALLEQLRQDGYEPIPVEGHYGGNPENSFIVPNMSDEDALRYGKQFGQQSVLTPKGLVYQDGSINPSDKNNIDFSGKQEDFYTKITIAGKPVKFSIPIDFDTKIPAVTEDVRLPSEKSEKRAGKPPRPTKPANPATNDQKMRINILAKNLGLTSEQRHTLQQQLTGKASLRAMTADEAKLVDQHLTKLATEKGLITATAQELTARLREANLMPDEKPEVKGRREKGLRKLITTINEAVHNFMDRIWHIDRFIEQLDGMEKGPLYNTIWLKVRDGMNNAADAKHDRIQEFKNAGEAIFGDADTFSQFLTAKEQDLGGGVKVSPAERVGVYVYSKNKDSLRHLLGGNFASFEDPQLALVRVLETVTPQERAFGEWILQDMAENFDRVNQASILSLGRELTEQDNYFSMYLSEVELEQQDDFLSALLDLQRQPGVVPEPGETVARKKGAKQPIRLDAVANYLHHVDRLEQFVHMGPIARQVGGILNNREFKRTLNIITHNTGSSILNKWLKDATLGYTSEGTSWLAKQILFFRQAGVQYAMGWKIPSVFRQFLSLPTAAAVHPSVGARIGAHLIGSAKPSYYRGLQDAAFSKSSMMRHRSMERISDYINTRMTPAQRMQYRRNWSSEAMAWMQWADRHTAVIAWNGLYDAALNSPAVIKQFGLDGSEKAAIEFADDWVGRTQSMGNVTYLSDFFRGGVVEKLLTTFQNEDNTKWNFWAHDIIQAKRAGSIDKKMVTYRLLLSYIIPALLYGIIGRGRLQKNWKEVAFDESTYVLGPLFLAGRMAYNAIQGFAGGASGPEEIGWVELEKAIESALQGKGGKAALRGAKAVGGLTGRIPSQAITTGTGAYDLMTGETTDLRRLIYTDWSLTKYGTQFNDKEDQQGKPNYGPRK